MMSGHGTNTIFFDKKTKIRRPYDPHPLPPITSHICRPPPIPRQSGRHMCITPKPTPFPTT